MADKLKWHEEMGFSPCSICDHIPLYARNERHHVTPKESNGSGRKENHIPLCPTCHAEIGHAKYALLKAFSASQNNCWVLSNDKYEFIIIKSYLLDDPKWYDTFLMCMPDVVRWATMLSIPTVIPIYTDDKISIFRQTLPWQAKASGFPSYCVLAI